MDLNVFKRVALLALAVCCLTACGDATPTSYDANVAALTLWSLDDNGLLTVSGSGPMPDYGYGESYFYEYVNFYGKGGWYVENPAPWSADRDRVDVAVIKDGVTAVGNYAFYQCDAMTEVVIPEGVTRIGNGAFRDCPRLTGVTIPDSVLYIGADAFRNCDALTSVTIPESVLHIGKEAFAECDALTGVVVGEGVAVLEDGAFRDCPRLTGVALPDALEKLGAAAFRNCDALTNVSIPDRVAVIGERAFHDCDALQSVYVSARIRDISPYAFADCDSLASVTFPDELLPHNLMANPCLWIERAAFENCVNLTEIDLPAVDGDIDIDDGAFPDWTTVIRRTKKGP